MTILTDSEADKLQTAITQVLGGDWTHAGAMLFASALDDMSLQEALDAVGEWVGQPHDFRKIIPGDINQIVRRKRTRLLPSEAEINDQAILMGVGSDDYFVWRRRLILGMTRNRESFEQASGKALEASSRAREQPALTSTGVQADIASKTEKNIDWTHVGRKLK